MSPTHWLVWLDLCWPSEAQLCSAQVPSRDTQALTLVQAGGWHWPLSLRSPQLLAPRYMEPVVLAQLLTSGPPHTCTPVGVSLSQEKN